jgi:hypothetical protein
MILFLSIVAGCLAITLLIWFGWPDPPANPTNSSFRNLLGLDDLCSIIKSCQKPVTFQSNEVRNFASQMVAARENPSKPAMPTMDGFVRLAARIGVVGGTARGAANGYHHMRRRSPETPFPEICRILINLRYAILRNDQKKQEILGLLGYRCQSLHSLVIAVLAVEAGYFDNDKHIQGLFDEVIEAQLLKRNIPRELAN